MEYPKNKPVRLHGDKLRQLHYEVWERDEWTCQGENCPGGWALDSRPHHKIFRSQGGSDTMENLITLCIHCHGKEHGVNKV